MQLRNKFILHSIVYLAIIFIAVQPAILLSVQNLTPKSSYPDSIVITQIPTAHYPDDLTYCYRGDSQITVSVFFYNTAGNSEWMDAATTEFGKAGIQLTYVAYHWENTTGDNSYYDFEYEQKMTNYRNADHANIAISFTSLRFVGGGESLGGYSRVSSHLAIVSTGLIKAEYPPYLMTHEIAHLLGYFPEPTGHSTNPASLMYPVFSGSNLHFDGTDIQLLRNLH